MQLPLKWLVGVVSAFLLTMTVIPAATAQISFPIPPHTTPGNITAIEYFFDTDPGFGNGVALPATAGPDMTISPNIDISGLALGVHHLNIRARANGGWGITNRAILHIIPVLGLPPAAAADIVRAEYFIDTDPGIGNAISLPVARGQDISVSNLAVNISGLSNGVHQLFIRLQDAAGSWSLLNRSVLSVVSPVISFPPHAAVPNLAGLEYFFDTDPGMGQATPLIIPAGTDLQQYPFVADISGLADGVHTLFIRSTGNWSLTNSRSFVINSAALPVRLLHFDAQKQEHSVALNWQTADEQGNGHFIIQRSGNALSFDSIGTVTAAVESALTHNYTFTDRQPLAGTSYYRLKQVDVSGDFTYSPVIAVRLDDGHGLFTVNNPVHNTLLIYGQAAGAYQVTDLSGQVVWTIQATGKAVKEVNISSLPAGAYLIRGQRNGTTHQLKFIKQ